MADLIPPQEWEQKLQEVAPMVYNLGLRLFRNEEDALDFSQDVFLQVLKQIHKFEGRSKFSTWVYSTAMNLGLNKIKKNKRWKAALGDSPVWDKVEFMVEDEKNKDGFELLKEEELESQIQEQLAKLPDVYRIPLLLHYFDEMKYEEISEMLDMNLGTLKSNIHRGKVLLKKQMIESGYTQLDQ